MRFGRVQNELDLRQIVVVGSQNVGKSSLIESMSGVSPVSLHSTLLLKASFRRSHFPETPVPTPDKVPAALRHKHGFINFAHRCPMEVRLQSATKWSCKVSLRFQYDSRGDPLAEVHEHDFGPTLYNKKDVEKTLGRARRAILRPSIDPDVFINHSDLSDHLLPASRISKMNVFPLSEPMMFSANCVCIRVEGPKVPDLYFYDLPSKEFPMFINYRTERFPLGIIANVRDAVTSKTSEM